METSIQIDPKLEPKKGSEKLIRSKLYIGGYVYIPIDENKCEVIYILQIDPQGHIGSLANKGEKKVANRITTIRQWAKLVK